MEMKEVGRSRVHWSFWLVGGIALVWNLMGVGNYMMQMNAENFAGMPEWWLAVTESRPVWATGAMAISVFGGALAGLLMLLRKSAAFYLFVISFVGTVATLVHAAGVPGAGARQIFEGMVMPLAVSAIFVWYAKRVVRKGWVT